MKGEIQVQSMKFCIIGSGSKGNMTYIETKETKVLLDAGISFLTAKKRVKDENIDFSDVSAVIITHEHYDHVCFLPTILKKTKATLYINKYSYDNLEKTIKDKIPRVKIKFLEADTRYRIKDLDFLTLKLSHDSANIFGYVFISEDKRLAYITDTGFFPLKYIEIIRNVDALIIESNHDVEMLLESERPWALKERILSPNGHMSNHICQQLLIAVLNEKHKIVILAHISLECNSVEIIESQMIPEIKKVFSGDIILAEQFRALKLYQI
ncbi:MAG: MBL fold metallo-hydrolase [Bacilli bacterium]|nr:MBL fold metallo-hydrolase [Bacilli bacterium]MDD4076497.1 MBL fold metallo-hydrolase [Bacilli bacterium]MDD4387623.1 MBL fold metallo-hydrolase [Bacilli bacterium]